jgi:hypothetical protein
MGSLSRILLMKTLKNSYKCTESEWSKLQLKQRN